MDSREKNSYPAIHFAAKYGWLNDPNGLVYHDGIYELYYQANPNGIEWADMTWGHARSKDLLHWEELEPVMYPDENGMMYSGCGLRNDRGVLGLDKDVLLFPYTAAFFNKERMEPHFTIRLAVSDDGGNTFIKRDGKILDELAPDNRDPKVFWHEESGAYILVLWLENNDMGIFRSGDFEYFELAGRFTMEGGFECPDLVRLPVQGEDGTGSESKWVFWAADGSYVVGDFDGYKFTPVQKRRSAYFDTRIPYAAQTWSGDPKGRVLQVPWLRTKCINKKTTGTMGLVRELSLVAEGSEYTLKQSLPEEIKDAFAEKEVLSAGKSVFIGEEAESSEEHPRTIKLNIDKPQGLVLKLFGEDKDEEFLEISYNSATRNLIFTSGVVSEIMNFGFIPFESVELVYDQGIIEATIRDNTVLSVIDIPQLRPVMCSRIEMSEGDGKVTVGVI